MIKKTIMLLILISTFSMMISFKTKAYVETSINDISNLFYSWTLEDNNGIYLARSNRIKNTAIEIDLALNTTFAPGQLISFENAFLDSNQSETSRISIYEDSESIHQYDSYNLVYEAPEATEWMFLKDDSDGWSVSIPDNYYYEIVLVINPITTSSVRSYIMSALNDNYRFANQMAIDITMNARSTYVIIDPTIESELSLLPDTFGSVFENVDSMANVSMYREGYTVSFQILYDRTYDMEYTFSENTDMSVFNNDYKVHYYSHEGSKFILISHGETSMFDSETADTFIPYTIWNLTTNEIETHNRLKAYLTSQLESANNAYAYFYVDEFVIDHLMSVSLAFRYKYLGLFEDDQWEEPIYKVLEADTTVEGLDPTSWQFDFLTGAAVATSIGMMIPGAGWPVALIGGLAMAYVGATVIDDPISFGNINQIEEVITPDNDIKQRLNEAYTLANPEFTGLDDSLKVFKLHLGQFNKAFTTGIHIDQSYSVVTGQEGINIIEFTYRTNGQVYTIKGEQIDIEFTPGPGTVEPPTNDDGLSLWDIIVAFVKDAYQSAPVIFWILGAFLFVLVMIVLYNIWKFLKVGLKIIFSPFGFFVIALALIVILISGVI
jgi:hypothetical protein